MTASRTVLALGVVASLLALACAADPLDAVPQPAAESNPQPAKIEPPDGVVSASLFQYRADWAQGLLQVRVRNDTTAAIKVTGVQFVWSGFTTPLAERNDSVVAGQIVDFPVEFVGAECDGPDLITDAPDVATAVVKLQLEDGSQVEAEVYDASGVAEAIFLDDCERQWIDNQVAVEWVDLRDGVVDGRPVTEGGLRLSRRASTTELEVVSISGTILFTFQTVDDRIDDPVAVLHAAEDEVIVPIRITENRCDAHARSESSQSFRFFADIEIGGAPYSYTVVPSPDDQVAMRARLEAGCAALGDGGFLGSDP